MGLVSISVAEFLQLTLDVLGSLLQLGSMLHDLSVPGIGITRLSASACALEFSFDGLHCLGDIFHFPTKLMRPVRILIAQFSQLQFDMLSPDLEFFAMLH